MTIGMKIENENGDSRGTYNINSQNEFKTPMLKSSLCDYSDAYILVKRTISVTALPAGGDNRDMQLYLLIA